MTVSGIKTINKSVKYVSIAVGALCSAAVSSMVKSRLGVKAIEDEINEGVVKSLLPFKKDKDAPLDTPEYMRDLTDEELMQDF